MREPISLRISDASNPKRGEKFERALERRKANISKVLQALIDAYIEMDAHVVFPVKIVSEEPSEYGSEKQRTG